MKKRFYLLIVLLTCFGIIRVEAVNSSATVGSNLTQYSCSAFQDKKVSISGDTYFGRCMEARCNGNKWKLSYYSTDSVSCTNGNLNPYISITKNGCSNYQNNSCSGNNVKYCSTITYFDCNRTANGSTYKPSIRTTVKPTTKAPKTTKTTTTTTSTTTTAPALDSNTYLSSLSISSGTISFDKTVREYNIQVSSEITSINVQAVPEANTSQVKVEGNNNIGNNGVITITVTAQNGAVGVYKINVTKQVVISNNANLSSLTVDGYNLNFSKDVYDYTLKIKKEKNLQITATPEEANAFYLVEGNSNLKKNSVISIKVTAPDGTTTQTYTIKINKKGNNTLLIILFLLILFAVIGFGAYYFITKMKNSGESEYEYE